MYPTAEVAGSSGPFGDNYSVIKECEDVAALVEKTGTQNIFGLSSGAIIALRASLAIPSLRSVAVYEPALSVKGSIPVSWVPRYEREIVQGKITQALITVFKGIPVGPPLFVRSPRFILVLSSRSPRDLSTIPRETTSPSRLWCRPSSTT